MWKSHTVEKLDRSNLPVLNKLEKDIKLRDKFEYVNSAVKSYFRGKDAIAESGIYALLKLITYNKSANSCSFADKFDYIVEREGQVKHISLSSTAVFKIRIFSGIDFSCTAITLEVAARNRKRKSSCASLANVP